MKNGTRKTPLDPASVTDRDMLFNKIMEDIRSMSQLSSEDIIFVLKLCSYKIRDERKNKKKNLQQMRASQKC